MRREGTVLLRETMPSTLIEAREDTYDWNDVCVESPKRLGLGL